jgi:phosphoglycerate dehydrogenase-like enzyme
MTAKRSNSAETVIAFMWPEEEFRATGLARPDGYEMRFGHSGDRAAVEAGCAGADYIVFASGFGRVDKALLDLAPAARLVQLTGAGKDNVDRAECARRGIPVANMPGLNAPSVAQFVVQLAFRLARPLPVLAEGGAEAWTAARRANRAGHELGGRVGVIGYGNIGRHVARLFAGLGLEVARAAHAGQDDPVVPALALDDLLASSDIIAVCLPSTPGTQGLIDARRVGLIKRGAILINTGRGGIVDEAAVAEALRGGRLAGIGFDVFATEPVAAGHPFFALPDAIRARVILTPHIAGQTLQSKTRNFQIALDNVARVARGEAPLYQIPPPAGA